MSGELVFWNTTAVDERPPRPRLIDAQIHLADGPKILEGAAPPKPLRATTPNPHR